MSLAINITSLPKDRDSGKDISDLVFLCSSTPLRHIRPKSQAGIRQHRSILKSLYGYGSVWLYGYGSF